MPHQPPIPSSGVEQLPSTAEAALHIQGATANGPTASIPATQVLAHGDTFVFQPNFGHDVITNSNPVSNAGQTDPTIVADLLQLLDAAHQTASGNAVIATDAHALHDVISNQLKQHQGDFHLM